MSAERDDAVVIEARVRSRDEDAWTWTVGARGGVGVDPLDAAPQDDVRGVGRRVTCDISMTL